MEEYGIFQVTIPLPYWNDNVHCYLATREGKWIIVDTGLKWEVTRKTWEEVFAKHGIDPTKDIESIVLTHQHGDHFGFSGMLQEWTGAPVHLNEIDRELSLYGWTPETFQAYYLSAGLPQESVLQLQENAAAFVRPTSPYPTDLQPLNAGDRFQLGELAFEAIHLPGHTPGHICFYNEQKKLLISGDHLTRETMPYISYHGYGDSNPLQTYLATLSKMQAMEIAAVLPGHGPIFYDAQERIAEVIDYYQSRLDAVRELAAGGRTAYEISLAIFPADRSLFQKWIDLGETNACLQYLLTNGDLQVREEGSQKKYYRN